MKIRCLFAVGVAFLVGCGSSERGPYASTGEQQRDPVQAEALYRKAVAALSNKPSDGDRADAERDLRQALGFDLYLGPAHNNLGVLLLQQGHLYDAAEEFAWARKLMPGNPEPGVNLAIVLERGGKYTDAIDAAKTALEVAPGSLAAMQAIAYVQVREGLTDGSTSTYLSSIAMRGDDAWRTWALKQHMEGVKP